MNREVEKPVFVDRTFTTKTKAEMEEEEQLATSEVIIPPTALAQIIYSWAQNDHKPANGSFIDLFFQNGIIIPNFA